MRDPVVSQAGCCPNNYDDAHVMVEYYSNQYDCTRFLHLIFSFNFYASPELEALLEGGVPRQNHRITSPPSAAIIRATNPFKPQFHTPIPPEGNIQYQNAANKPRNLPSHQPPRPRIRPTQQPSQSTHTPPRRPTPTETCRS